MLVLHPTHLIKIWFHGGICNTTKDPYQNDSDPEYCWLANISCTAVPILSRVPFMGKKNINRCTGTGPIWVPGIKHGLSPYLVYPCPCAKLIPRIYLGHNCYDGMLNTPLWCTVKCIFSVIWSTYFVKIAKCLFLSWYYIAEEDKKMFSLSVKISLFGSVCVP
jgi:hypothetical protein